MKLTDSQLDTCVRYAELPLPRHTSYPTAPVWKADWGVEECTSALRGLRPDVDTALYVHVPYCRSLCYYCACNKEIISDAQRAAIDPTETYLDGVSTELDRLKDLVGPRLLRGMHLGGGTPTFLKPDGLDRLLFETSRRFGFTPDIEAAAEVDPRVTSAAHLEALRRHGFTRLSCGIQDFDERSQQLVNRIQPFEMVRDFTAEARRLGFDSINFDLIYGLPGQTIATIDRTLDRVLELSPDRVAFYRLAVIPEIFKWQRGFSRQDLPKGRMSLGLMVLAVNRFTDAGYRFIGLDHFAKPDEGLAKAHATGDLQRNFQGMTTGRGLVNLAVGPSAISSGPDFFAQNVKSSKDWKARLAKGGLATERGMTLTADDRIRADLLQQIYGYASVDLGAIGQRHAIEARTYFARELHVLEELAREGLVELTGLKVTATEVGRLLLRVIGAVFDAYLPCDAWRVGIKSTEASSAG